MNRAFVTEQDGWNLCRIRDRYCKDATMRGECERDRCKYGPEETDAKEKKETGGR